MTFVVDAYVETDLYNCNINVVVTYSNSGTNDDALLIAISDSISIGGEEEESSKWLRWLGNILLMQWTWVESLVRLCQEFCHCQSDNLSVNGDDV